MAQSQDGRSSTMNTGGLRPNEYKVILIGAVGVGKTSLLMRYVHNEFQDTPNKFVSEEKKAISINGQEMVLYLWDTAGQERYQSITQRFYTDASAVVIVYDITDSESYNEATKNWYGEATTYANPNSNIPILLVGNKTDLDDKRVIPFKAAKEFCDRHAMMPPVEISAKTDKGKIAKAFDELAKKILASNVQTRKSSSVRVRNTEKGCCSLM